MTTRRELIDAVAARYRAAGRSQKKEILDEFVKVTGFHRKHAIRALKKSLKQETPEPRQRARIYDEAVREALTIVWEAADRICGKRLRQVMAGMVNAMERHGHLKLDAAVRESLLSMSAATMDRLLTTVRDTAKRAVAER
jgi:preprotein translocase subunit SecA